MDKTRTIYNFRNICYRCFNDIDIPLLSDFAYGEILCQTKDGQEFYIAELLDNPTFDFVSSVLTQQKEIKSKLLDSQKILVLLADKPNGKDFTKDYPICPICKNRQKHFTDSKRTTERKVGFVTWTHFESLTQDNKLKQVEDAINHLVT